MVQDFAKDTVRAGPDDRQATPASPAWGMLITGLMAGLVLGVSGSFLAYVAGIVPDLPGSDTVTGTETALVDEEAQSRLNEELERAAARLQLEFYQELPNYEVVVDATPIVPPESESVTGPDEAQSTTRETAAATPPEPARSGFMVQAGAFQQQNSALARRDQLLDLGLNARVKQEALLGRTLYLVQAGPYPDRDSLARAERLLRNNNIESMRIAPGSR